MIGSYEDALSLARPCAGVRAKLGGLGIPGCPSKCFLIYLTILNRMMDTVRSEGRVVGSKVSAVELEQIKMLVESGVYLNTSDFVRDAIRDKLAAIKTIKYRDVDYETAKKEVMGYFQERGEAYPSEIEEDLELDYDLIRQIVDELKREGRLEVL